MKHPTYPAHLVIRGARVHNLKGIDLDIPLGKRVGIAGVSGSGKSSLALGVLYAEGSRRYLESLSAYTRRRMTQAAEARADLIENIPAALALHQRPAVPGIRSTFGTSTELLNSMRLMVSRLGSHCCPNGHRHPPTERVAMGLPLTCPVCHTVFNPPGAESFSFNSEGACPDCGGTGMLNTIDLTTLVPDESLTIEQGAVAPWNSLMWSLMVDVCREMGVRTDVPFHQLSEQERDIVFHGPPVKKHILYKAKNSNQAAELDFTYYNAVYTVENALAKVKDEKGMKRVEKFLKQQRCPSCGGCRLSAQARSSLLNGLTLADISAMPLDDLIRWVQTLPASLPETMKEMADTLVRQFLQSAGRLIDLGLGYLSLDRSGASLSTGERQRVQLARAVRSRSTGVLYVLDEPSIGLHPANTDGLMAMIDDLIAHGNSVVLVDHDPRVLRRMDWLIEMGPGAGTEGGQVLFQGPLPTLNSCPQSRIAPFLQGKSPVIVRPQAAVETLFDHGTLHLSTRPLHTVQALDVDLPKGRLIAVTGVSGSGKTTLILESLVPALQALSEHTPMPSHIRQIQAPGLNRVCVIDAAPIGTQVRSTVATYSGVLDELRRVYAAAAKKQGLNYRASDFSYNTGSLRCPVCDGTGQITMDVQFLPDIDIPCPSCGGTRYKEEARRFACPLNPKHQKTYSLPELLQLTVDQALQETAALKKVSERLQVLSDLGLGYLTLAEATPALSGGEAQRLKLAAQMSRSQEDTVFVFDEPTIGLHPLDVQVLIGIFQKLIDNGATVIVIEHDLDLILNADYLIDMGPGGGLRGGRIVAAGSVAQVAACQDSLTGRYLREELQSQ